VTISPRHVESLQELRDALPLLASKQLAVGLAIQAPKLGDARAMAAVFELVEDARAQGVEVRPWLLLSFRDGYFANARNHSEYARAARELVRQWQQRGLPPSTLVVDMEPPRELQAALSSLRLGKALPVDHIDRARFAEATRAYAALVDELHQRRWQVLMTTLAPLLADYRDGDDDLRQYFNVVIDGVAWDQLNFQLYRSAFSENSPDLGPHFVYSYVREALARFPDKVLGFDLGLTHPGPISQDTPSLEKPADLRSDIEAALAAGADPRRLSVFNLKGILVGAPRCDKFLKCAPDDYVYGPHVAQDWLREPNPQLAVPEQSSATGVLSRSFDGIDRVLDSMAPERTAQGER
jgi:hypothetical protein